MKLSSLRRATLFAAASVLACASTAFAQDQPNILVLWGDDIG